MVPVRARAAVRNRELEVDPLTRRHRTEWTAVRDPGDVEAVPVHGCLFGQVVPEMDRDAVALVQLERGPRHRPVVRVDIRLDTRYQGQARRRRRECHLHPAWLARLVLQDRRRPQRFGRRAPGSPMIGVNRQRGGREHADGAEHDSDRGSHGLDLLGGPGQPTGERTRPVAGSRRTGRSPDSPACQWVRRQLMRNLPVNRSSCRGSACRAGASRTIRCAARRQLIRLARAAGDGRGQLHPSRTVSRCIRTWSVSGATTIAVPRTIVRPVNPPRSVT